MPIPSFCVQVVVVVVCVHASVLCFVLALLLECFDVFLR